MYKSFFSGNEKELHINAVQQYKLCDWLSSIYHFEFDEKGIDPQDTVDAFKAMLLDEIPETDKQKFIDKNLWPTIQKVRQMMSDPQSPKNLDLIQYNDAKTPRITNEAVTCYLKELIDEKINVISSRQLNRPMA